MPDVKAMLAAAQAEVDRLTAEREAHVARAVLDGGLLRPFRWFARFEEPRVLETSEDGFYANRRPLLAALDGRPCQLTPTVRVTIADEDRWFRLMFRTRDDVLPFAREHGLRIDRDVLSREVERAEERVARFRELLDLPG